MIPGSRPVLVCHTPEEHDWDDLATPYGKVARLCNRCGAFEMNEDAKDAEPPPSQLERACPHGDPTCPCQDGDPCHYEAAGPTEPMVCTSDDCTVAELHPRA